MKNKIFLLLFFVFSCLNAQTNRIHLVTNGQSDYKIIIGSSASQWDSLAANVLQNYVQEISSALLQVENDLSPVIGKEIVIGVNKHSEGMDLSSIHDKDGFIIKTVDDKIYFLGGEGKGTLNAVYSFLEKYLNCRMYSAKAQIIPKQNSITLPDISISENPVFSYRTTNYKQAMSDEYAHWHKLVDANDHKIWGMFVHTFQQLLPPEKYFKEHPEYYAFRNGVRVPEQPCLSNPEVLKIVTDELRKRMKENPEAEIWSVSQNDNVSYCECPECSRLDKEEGSPSGSMLNFVNKVAREFPDKTISTLAYEYTRKAPEHIKPEKNVNIMLCTIECYRTNPLESDTSAGSFTHDLIAWSKLTHNIFLWDYVVQFTNYVSPFPNFQVLQPNIQLFAKYGAKMIFEQGAGGTDGAEFNELRCYLISKLLWDPTINVDSVMDDFLNGYYGKAGKYIRTYIDLMRNELVKSGAQLWIYGSPVESMKDYLAPELLKKYDAIFEDAENAVKDNQEILERVKIAHLPVKYAMLEQAKVVGIGETGTFIKNSGGEYVPNPVITNLLDEFLTGCKSAGYVFVHEKGVSADEYIARYNKMLSKMMKNPLGLFKPVKYIIPASDKYPANGDKTLTDGLRGDEDHHFNWQGFEGEDMDVIIDLQKPETISNVSADFLQIAFSWIFFPEQVEVSVSDDGTNFKTVSIVKNKQPLDENAPLITAAHKIVTDIQTFAAEFEPVEARYVRVKAVSIKTCPRWHPGYPFKAWIFTDEVEVY